MCVEKGGGGRVGKGELMVARVIDRKGVDGRMGGKKCEIEMR